VSPFKIKWVRAAWDFRKEDWKGFELKKVRLRRCLCRRPRGKRDFGRGVSDREDLLETSGYKRIERRNSEKVALGKGVR